MSKSVNDFFVTSCSCLLYIVLLWKNKTVFCYFVVKRYLLEGIIKGENKGETKTGLCHIFIFPHKRKFCLSSSFAKTFFFFLVRFILHKIRCRRWRWFPHWVRMLTRQKRKKKKVSCLFSAACFWKEKVSCCRQTEELGCCFNEIEVCCFLYTLIHCRVQRPLWVSRATSQTKMRLGLTFHEHRWQAALITPIIIISLLFAFFVSVCVDWLPKKKAR